MARCKFPVVTANAARPPARHGSFGVFSALLSAAAGSTGAVVDTVSVTEQVTGRFERSNDL